MSLHVGNNNISNSQFLPIILRLRITISFERSPILFAAAFVVRLPKLPLNITGFIHVLLKRFVNINAVLSVPPNPAR